MTTFEYNVTLIVNNTLTISKKVKVKRAYQRTAQDYIRRKYPLPYCAELNNTTP